MKLCLLTLMLLAQTWEWTDAQGVTHFTDDRSTIPKGAQAKQTEGDDISEVAAPAMPRVVKPVSSKRSGVDRCAQGKKRVDQLEVQVAQAERTQFLSEAAYRNDCGALMSADRVDCQALMPRFRPSRRPAPAPTSPSLERLKSDLEKARDELRKVQSDGC